MLTPIHQHAIVSGQSFSEEFTNDHLWDDHIAQTAFQYVAGGKLNGKGIQRINAMIGNWIYYTQESDGKLRYCVTKKEAFLSGDTDSARIMITMDAAIHGEADNGS